MITKEDIKNKLDIMYPNPVCELIYNKDYELLIAVVLSAHSTDASVNKATKVLFDKYDIFSLSQAKIEDIQGIIRVVGSYTRKAFFVSNIAKILVRDNNGSVPNDRDYLESLPGVGRKTASVVLANLFNEPTIAVDTHVFRVSARLGISTADDSLALIEHKLMKKFPKKEWNRINDQLVLFGRYTCKSIKPKCAKCLFNDKCELAQYLKHAS